MVVGLEVFSLHFKDFQDSYIIIGGTACDIIIEGAGFTPRATDDIDMILIVEALSPEFVTKFWEFIKLGKYAVQQKNQEERNCYRFASPANPDYPKQLELFCKVPDVIDANEGAHLTPIPVEEGLSSLSAILLDENYYNYTIEHSEVKEGVHFAIPQTLICLKAFAFLNNTERKAAGQNVRTVDIKKHKNDVFRMVMMLTENDRFVLPGTIKADLKKFVDTIKDDLPSTDTLTSNGFGNQDMNQIFNKLIQAFQLTL
ncbi:hypothetical protein EV196_108253 [Mariniflexile fucanivorans]|uniref:Nucleotidyltransferase AbiEii toxin of type IV toxin-antitoxin system n=1 Tax=Mariniflexile fucanivorans TaxID=264023 RepID=A0A4R1RES1_9FLAO|nr:hypothetical protein [Mariniflexile fucanivorans]TCL64052.1 hypothetical protein EV196_108253 [Mariniflexile fucanivorans]